MRRRTDNTVVRLMITVTLQPLLVYEWAGRTTKLDSPKTREVNLYVNSNQTLDLRSVRGKSTLSDSWRC